MRTINSIEALKAIEKRNKVCGNTSEYIMALVDNLEGGCNTMEEKAAEAAAIEYIVRLCEVEIMIHTRNTLLGNKNSFIEEKIENPPHHTCGIMKKMIYINRLVHECRNDLENANVFIEQDYIEKKCA